MKLKLGEQDPDLWPVGQSTVLWNNCPNQPSFNLGGVYKMDFLENYQVTIDGGNRSAVDRATQRRLLSSMATVLW